MPTMPINSMSKLYAGALLIVLIIGSVLLILNNDSYAAITDEWKIRTVGDIEYTDRGKQVAAATKAQEGDLTVLLGDYYGKENQVLGMFKQSDVPLLADCGNHDSCSNVLDEYGNFESYPTLVKHKTACLVGVNTETSISDQKSKIEPFLNDCQNDSFIKHIILHQHKATITNDGAHHPESETEGYRTQYVQWQESYHKFDLLLQGHNHNYQTCEPESPDILVITIGTGGRNPYKIGGGNDDNCNVNQSGHNYDGPAVITVKDSGYDITKINLD
jgi:hypothetical protein